LRLAGLAGVLSTRDFWFACAGVEIDVSDSEKARSSGSPARAVFVFARDGVEVLFFGAERLKTNDFDFFRKLFSRAERVTG